MANTTLEARQNQWQLFQQYENAAKTYTVNWAAELDTDTISTSTWTAETSGATIASESNTTTTTSARLSGDPGYKVLTNKIVTAAGDTMERQVHLKIHDNSAHFKSDYPGYCGYWW